MIARRNSSDRREHARNNRRDRPEQPTAAARIRLLRVEQLDAASTRHQLAVTLRRAQRAAWQNDRFTRERVVTKGREIHPVTFVVKQNSHFL